MTDQTTALAIPTGTALTSLFRTPDAADPIIARIRAEVMSHAPDHIADALMAGEIPHCEVAL